MPEACCRREPQSRDGVLLSREECLLGRDLFLNKQVPGLLPQVGGPGWPELCGWRYRPRASEDIPESHGNVDHDVGLNGADEASPRPEVQSKWGKGQGGRKSSNGIGQRKGHFGWG